MLDASNERMRHTLRHEYDQLEVLDQQLDDDEAFDQRSSAMRFQERRQSQVKKVRTFREWILDSRAEEFHIAVGIVIAINSIVIGLETDLGAEHFLVLEYIFCTVYICEMTMRLFQEGCREYFSSFSSWFDCSLVVTGSLDLFVLSHLDNKSRSLQFLKMGRLLRALRVLRVARLFKMFRGLEIILKAYADAFQSVLWVGTVIIILDYILAVFCTQLIGHKADQWPEESQPKVELWFGTIARSMRTLFIVMTLASWDVICYTLMERIPGYVIFPLACSYIMLASYTMVSLITGVISESLITTQSKDEQNRVQELEANRKQLGDDLYQLLESMDLEKKGKLSRKDVKDALVEHPDIIPKLHAHEIKIEEAELIALIDRLTHADPLHLDLVDISHVRDAIMSMEGLAKASAVQDLKHRIMSLGHNVQGLSDLLKGARGRCGRPDEIQSSPQRLVDADGSQSRVSVKSEASVKSMSDRPELAIHRRVVALSSQMQRLEEKLGSNQQQVESKLDELAQLLRDKNKREEAASRR